MTRLRDSERVVAALRTSIVGEEILALEIHAINALKTVEPTPAILTGQTIVDVSIDADGRLCLLCREAELIVDLARTGGVEASAALGPWRPRAGRTPPTGRLLLVNGAGVDFTEPARTKRITFSVVRCSHPADRDAPLVDTGLCSLHCSDRSRTCDRAIASPHRSRAACKGAGLAHMDSSVAMAESSGVEDPAPVTGIQPRSSRSARISSMSSRMTFARRVFSPPKPSA